MGDPFVYDVLHAALKQCLDDGCAKGIPGLAAHVESSTGTLWSGNTGLSNIEAGKTLDGDHVFGIGSISKVFMSLTILQLIGEKKLEINDTVAKYLKEDILQGIPHAGKATIGQLLSHTSGIPSWEDDPKWIAEGRGKKLDPARIWGKKETLEYIRYENHVARDLVEHIEQIRIDYMRNMTSELMVERQKAVVIYLTDKMAKHISNERLSRPHEKIPQSFAWNTLKYEHVQLQEPQNVAFSLGKFSLQVNVHPQVFKNFKIFVKAPKTVGDLVFDRVTTTSLNKYLSNYMPGLTTKTIDQHHILTEPFPRAEPGKFSYSNTNFTFLGLITEAITGETAESQMRKRILEPLNLTKTYIEGFEPNPLPLENLVPDRYHWANPEFEKTAGICSEFLKPETRQDLINASKSNTSVEWTAGGYISHPSDLCKLALAIRSCDPRIISPASQELMYQFQDVPGARNPLQVGHGIFRTSRQEGVFLGHNGSVLGFAGMMFWSEEEDVAISVLGNVGTMHAGVVANAADVGLGKEFLESVMKLARVKSAKN